MSDNVVPFPRTLDEVTDLDIVRECLVEIIFNHSDPEKVKAEAGEALDLVETLIMKESAA